MVRIQQYSHMCCWTVWWGLNNTRKNNMVYALLILATGSTVCVPSKVCQDTLMPVKYVQNVFIIPNQTYIVTRCMIYRNVTYKANKASMCLVDRYFNYDITTATPV